MLKQRVISAVILAVIVVGTILWLDNLYVSALFALILFVSMLELTNMTLTREKPWQWLAGLLMAGLFFATLPLIDLRYLYYLSYAGLVIWLTLLVFMFHYRFSGHWTTAMRLAMFLLSTLLLWICVHGLTFIHGHFAHGPWILMYVLTLVWVADIGAYFSGKRFGRHKLAPGISPGKTWQGVAGGLLLNVAWISLVFLLIDGWGIGFGWFLLLGIATSAISVVGDLYESILKREAGLKDSGRILPGHGGVLDRIDSVIAATPVFISGLYMLGAM